jgi:hypothetical protein
MRIFAQTRSASLKHSSSHDGLGLSQWQRFFKEFTRLAQKGVALKAYAPLNPQACAAFFAAFADAYAACRAQGRAVDIWRVAGIGNDELRNSAILAWLLDCHGSHGQGAAFLRQLFSCLPGWKELAVAADYRTRVESSYDENEPGVSKNRSRVDIEVDGLSFFLLLEIKIRSGETDNQLERYLRLGEARKGNRPWALLFVTPDGRLPVDAALHGQVYCLSWQTLGRALAGHAATMPPCSHGTIAVQQFCAHMARL